MPDRVISMSSGVIESRSENRCSPASARDRRCCASIFLAAALLLAQSITVPLNLW